MADLNCKVVLPEVAIDVGRKFDLVCNSESLIDQKLLEGKNFNLPEKDKYIIKILSTQFKDSEVRFTVVSYQVGSHKLSDLQIENIKINPIEFEVKSLQDPQSPRQQPFEFVGPIETRLPWYFWLSWILFFVLLISIFLVWWRQKKKFKTYILEANEIIKIKPDKYIYQNLRQLLRQRSLSAGDQERNKSDLFKLRNIYLLYLTSKFQIPFLYWTKAKALRALKKIDLSNKIELKTIQVVKELDNLIYKNVKKDFASQDVEQMIRLVKKNVDEIETLHRMDNGF